MTTSPRTTPTTRPDDRLEQQIAAALRSREPHPDATTATAARIQVRLARDPAPGAAPVTLLARRAGVVTAAGLAASTLALVGAGAAAAAHPYSGFAVAVEDAAQAVGLEWSAMPDGYTREQYEAFWGGGFSSADVDALAALWSTDATTAKSRAGQLLLDGGQLPVTPSPGTADVADPLVTFFDEGYTWEDAQEAAALWQVDVAESKARIGQMLIDGEQPPVEPSGTTQG